MAAIPAIEQETTLLSFLMASAADSAECGVEGRAAAKFLAQAKPKPNVTTVLLRAADGYYETFRLKRQWSLPRWSPTK